MPCFRVLNLPSTPEFVIALKGDGRIGRDASAEYVLPHPTVSRLHAAFHEDGGKYVVTDLGSANGTLINGKKMLVPATLREGDQLLLGRLTLVYFDADLPAPQQDTELRALPRSPATMGVDVTASLDESREQVTREDLQLAARAQRKVLPAIPNIPGYSIAAQWLPHYLVGGDFYDFRAVRKGEWAFVVGDVSGKGVAAALSMMQVMTAAKVLLPQCNSPTEFAEKLNAVLIDGFEDGVFATMAVAYLNLDKGLVRLALAGHSAPVLRTPGGKVVETDFQAGPPLCSTVKLNLEEFKLQLQPGDSLIMSTDGVDEAEPTAERLPFVSRVFFGMDKRNRALVDRQGADLLAIGLREAVFSYRGEARSSDDLTVLVIERLAKSKFGMLT